jgi:hypothetical protein
LKPATIPSNTCPETALQLLSLRKDSDGFAILQNLVKLRSPQLQGKFKDYRGLINDLQIIPGEHIREFFSRAESLGQEIDLAQLEDGSNAALCERFLTLLRDTNDFIIIGETSRAWKDIQSFRRDPKHLRKPLPWTFEEILRDLEIAKITTLTTAVTPVSLTPSIDAHVAYGHRLHRPIPITPTHPKYVTQAIHTTKDGRHLLSSPTSNPIQSISRCKLCNNGHPYPWHTEENCPFIDPTHILCKTTRENVMQHNSLHGAINKKFSKNQDTLHNTNPQRPPPVPTILSTRKATPTVRFTTRTPSTPPPPSDPLIASFNPQQPPTDDQPNDSNPYLPFEATDDDSPAPDDIIHTEYYDFPVTPTANVCTGFTDINPSFDDSTAFQDLILDPTQYLSFSA